MERNLLVEKEYWRVKYGKGISLICRIPQRGDILKSDTYTETSPHLIEGESKKGGNLKIVEVRFC
ncbi:MAG: hypothetical protein RBG13Loki_0539 [Promethearchaeota archaeon CR_4]|nr:MAG: hypothetical protein RBG13Loki_0539 [Candidatus Lokiarchaeota archaeon CR_4]